LGNQSVALLALQLLSDYSVVDDNLVVNKFFLCKKSNQKESPAVADKPAQRESMPKIAPSRRAYNVVADNTGLSSFV